MLSIPTEVNRLVASMQSIPHPRKCFDRLVFQSLFKARHDVEKVVIKNPTKTEDPVGCGSLHRGDTEASLLSEPENA